MTGNSQVAGGELADTLWYLRTVFSNKCPAQICLRPNREFNVVSPQQVAADYRAG
jgi:hypothetical protein